MFNAYGTLVNGLAVCQGYALAYMDLLSANGVKSYFVSSKNINHAWLIIETEKGWYHSDVTWDDPRLEAGDYTNDGDYMGYCQHDYFMNTVADINASHFKMHQMMLTRAFCLIKRPLQQRQRMKTPASGAV